MSAPTTDQETLRTRTAAEDPRIARGAMHVRIGLALNILGSLALLLLTSRGTGPEATLSAADWIGAIVSEVVLIAAVLSSSRIARGFVAFTGAAFVTLAVAAAAFALSLPSLAFDVGMPMLPLAGAMGLLGAGSLLATITPSARAWHSVRLAARAARRKARSLADWRAAP